MKTTEHGIENSKDVENIHHMRLMALLQELVREKGYKGAARVLGDRPADGDGQRQDRAAHAAGAGLIGAGVAGGRRLGRRSGSASATRSLKAGSRAWPGEVKGVAGEVEALGKEVRRRLSGIEGAVTALGRDDPQGTGAGHAGAGPQSEGSDEAGAGGTRAGTKASVEAVHAAGSTPTWRRGSLPRTTRRYSGRRGR